MADTSAIEWTDATWNPVTGCDRVSPGCANCYALELAPRLRRFAEARGKGKWLNVRDGGKASGPAFGVTLHPSELDRPLRWRKPRRVFVNSMSDLFHDEIPDDFIAQVFDVMREADRHTFQVLTKRPERMSAFLHRYLRSKNVPPPPNVWLGVTIENRRFVDRADVLRQTPAAVRFISAEPLLGPLVHGCPVCLGGGVQCSHCDGFADLDLTWIDWLIVGGESGPNHRPIRVEWVRDLLAAAECSGTAFFFKQWGGPKPKSGGRLLDGRTWDEYPGVARQEVARVAA